MGKYDRETKWKKENTMLVQVRFQDSSGIPLALWEMEEKTGVTVPQYVRRVITEALIRDGFFAEKQDKD